MKDLQISEARRGLGETGIFVRAQNSVGGWESVDIVELEKESLLAWLKSRGGDNPWAESVVLILLGHEP